ncbi:ATP-binding cassette domain-containing protein [Cnuibacter sp. UC19_7]|uniref:ATP-binding cassette domain-containing protein n=1 Tax=Cnuibacter sp. UC19_7 TaxID=3350166 RepID=UPI0036732E7F
MRREPTADSSAVVLGSLTAVSEASPRASGRLTGAFDVSLTVRRGSIHALLGEQFSGATQILAVLSGHLVPEGGTLLIDGREAAFTSPAEAEAAGIRILRGSPSLVPDMTVADNLFLGYERSLGFLAGRRRVLSAAAELLAPLGLDDSVVVQRARDLGPGARRVVEFAHAMVTGCRLMLVDEPFARLDAEERAVVSTGLRGLRAAGLTVVVATWSDADAVATADDVTVLSRGRVTMTAEESAGADVTRHDLAEAMASRIPRSADAPAPPARPAEAPASDGLVVTGYTVGDPFDPSRTILRDVSLAAARGEIVGIAGLAGSGASELLYSLYGRSLGADVSGTVEVGGAPFTASSPAASIAAGLALATDRHRTFDLGLLGGVPSRVSLPTLAKLARAGVVDRDRDYRPVAPLAGIGAIGQVVLPALLGQASGEDRSSRFGIRETIEFWLDRSDADRPTVVLLDDPLANLVPGDRAFVIDGIRRLAADGTAVVMGSTRIEELLKLTARVYTLADGRVSGVLRSAEATPADVLRCITERR